jgi:hypothetical protein
MKKLVVTLIVFFIVMGSVSLMAQTRVTVDLSTVKYNYFTNADNLYGTPTPGFKNAEPFKGIYDGMFIHFAAWPRSIDFTAFDRIIVKVKYYRANGAEIRQGDGQAMAVLVYDPTGDVKGPEQGAGPNTPLKQFNVGGTSSTISKDAGTALRLTKAPGGILLQNTNVNVKFIEVEEITFFKR